MAYTGKAITLSYYKQQNAHPMKKQHLTLLVFLLFSCSGLFAQTWACKQCISRNGTCSALPRTFTLECTCKKETRDLNGNGNISWLENFSVWTGFSGSLVVYETRTAIGTECFYTSDPNNCCYYRMPQCPCSNGGLPGSGGGDPGQRDRGNDQIDFTIKPN